MAHGTVSHFTGGVSSLKTKAVPARASVEFAHVSLKKHTGTAQESQLRDSHESNLP
jgi:hypothetical protein